MTLFNRKYDPYDPQQEDIIYRYCNAQTFYDICTNKSIRLNYIFAMNDFLEMRWGGEKCDEVLDYLKDDLDQDFLYNIIMPIFSVTTYHNLLVASCFSTEKDILGQWRGYADDGRGYAIGFKGRDLKELSPNSSRLLRVLYDEQEQFEELKKTILGLRDLKRMYGGSESEEFEKLCLDLAINIASYKNPAFAEEKEIRLIYPLSYEDINNATRITDQAVSFSMRNNTPVPYVDLSFADSKSTHPIKEIIIGPKNNSNPQTISMFLETLGIDSVNVDKSKASYW